MAKLPRASVNKQGIPDYSGPQNGRRSAPTAAVPSAAPRMCGCIGCLYGGGDCLVAAFIDETERKRSR